MLQIRGWKDWWDEESDLNGRSKERDDDDDDNRSTSASTRGPRFFAHRRLLLDVRSDEEHSERRFASSEAITVVHIPLADLTDRRFELPPRHAPMGILISSSSDDESSHQASSLLQNLQVMLSGGNGNRKRKNGEQEKTRERLVCPWNVTAVLLSNLKETWKQAQACGVRCVEGNAVRNFDTPFQPAPRLWQPDTMVEHVLLPLLRQAQLCRKNNTNSKDDTYDDEEPVQIWDLGAGVGRDVCFLSEELLRTRRNFCVVGLDQRYRDTVTNDAVSFWKRRQVDHVTACKCMDLSDTATVMKKICVNDGSVVKCLFAVRYWNRPLFLALVKAGRDNQLSKGTIIAISQFGRPHAGAPWDFPHPKEKHVLERNELRALFATTTACDTTSTCSWKIMHDEVVLDSDHGRTLIQFVAQLE